ncbi:PQQ-binding-like beta-propeller repeat protein [Cytophagaceae bacterium DM2B3-1]|uniref:PQQ-binding-like beta-propeller repeat protein n=1 Tax=Xanthocytophaga flava TaxID=3048013 RepID=A0ABT7CMR9_9BACT|nr:PQQ-binding-like beta-propeller repeat protein [Xanthocytophaga flavus]MDJ1495049.1 PQQ-binding-like beta-propeller repeat protein [Xanthocytophaga flavus]
MQTSTLFRYVLSILTLCISIISQAQTFQEHYFSDVERVKPTEWGMRVIRDKYNILIGGRTRSTLTAVWKIDTSGAIIWKTNIYTVIQIGQGRVLKMIIGSDQQIYAIFANGYSYYRTYEVIKLDNQTGQILWKSPQFETNPSNAEITDLVDYGQSVLITYYDTKDNRSISYSLALLDKTNGQTISTHRGSESLGIMAVDSSRNVFIASGNSLIKRRASDLSNTIWKVNLKSPTGKYLGIISRIQLDGDAILVFGSQKDYSSDRGIVARIDTASGDIKWATATDTYEVSYSDAKFAGDDLFVTWKHIYTGGGSYMMQTTRLNRLTGAVQWESKTDFEDFVASGYNGKFSEQAALSLDLDSSGDVYLTGYYNSGDYSPATWGITKLAGRTGQKLYESTIIEDSSKYDLNSVGIASLVVNDKPYFIGNLQGYYYHPNDGKFGYNGSILTMVQLDPDSGKIQKRTYIDGDTVYYASKTVAIKKVSASKVAVLKEVGRLLNVEMYDRDFKLLWSKTLLRNFKVTGVDLVPGTDGYLNVSGLATDTINPASAVFYRLDTLGNFKTTYTGENGYMLGESSSPLQIVNASENTHIFYKVPAQFNTGSDVYLLQWSDNPVRIENSFFWENGRDTPVMKPLNGNTLLVFQVDDIKRLSLPTTTFYTLSYQTLKTPSIPFQQVKDVLSVSGQRFVVAGDYLDSSKVYLYDYNTNKIKWKKDYTGFKVKKMIAGEETFIYLVGKVNVGSDTLLHVSKLDILTGEEVWTFTETDINYQSEAIDMVFDPSGYITIVGYSINARKTKSVLICRLNKLGQIVDWIQRESAYGDENAAVCAELIANGEIWIGGNFHHSAYKKEGFVYRYLYPSQPITNTPPQIIAQQFEVLANSSKGQMVGKVIATDEENASLAFSITAGNLANAFIIDKKSGILSVNDSVALSSGGDSYFLTVSVTEEKDISMHSSALITIVVKTDTMDVIHTFPNPTLNKLDVSLKNDWYGPMEFVLLNGMGEAVLTYRFVKNQEEFSHELDMSSLQGGMYIIKLTYGEKIITGKVLKH